MPYENEYQPPFRRGRDPLTPIQRLNQNYINRTGSYQLPPSNPVPDTQPGAVRRGGRDIWTRVKQELHNIRQGIVNAPRPTYPHEEAAGVAPYQTPFVKKVGEILKSPRPPYPHEIRDAQIAAESGKPTRQPARSSIVPAAEAAAYTMPLKPAHRPGVPTVETGAPASTYDRGEGAPTGTTRAASAISTGNRYLDMYYAGAKAQNKYLGKLPPGQAPIETIRGTKRAYWSPTTGREHATALEAAYGVDHKEEAAKAAARSKQQHELAKERIKARKPIEFKEAGIDPETQAVIYDAYDPNTGKKVTDDADVDAIKQKFNSFIALSPEQQDAELAKMPSKQRLLLIQMIRQLGEQQGGR